jgi:hypothetical protein
VTPGQNFRASIYEIISDALTASEEQLATMRSEALLELDRLRHEAADEARERVRQGQATADAIVRAAERTAAELRGPLADAIDAARRQVDMLEEQLDAFGATSSSVRGQLSSSREHLAEVDASLRRIHQPAQPTGPSVADEVPASPAAETEQAPPVPQEAPVRGSEVRGHDGEPSDPGEAPPSPGFKTQRRLAFSAAETRLASAALTNAAVDKLDLVEELVASPNFSAEERSLSLMVLLREAEQLSRMAAQFGRPPLELTERLLELRRRTTRLMHGDEPEG